MLHAFMPVLGTVRRASDSPTVSWHVEPQIKRLHRTRGTLLWGAGEHSEGTFSCVKEGPGSYACGVQRSGLVSDQTNDVRAADSDR